MNSETTTTLSQRDAYKLMLKEYPDVMDIAQMCQILDVSTKNGVSTDTRRQNLLHKSRSRLPYPQSTSFYLLMHRLLTAWRNKSDWRHPFRISSNDLYCSQVNGRCCPQQERRISYYGGRTPS